MVQKRNSCFLICKYAVLWHLRYLGICCSTSYFSLMPIFSSVREGIDYFWNFDFLWNFCWLMFVLNIAKLLEFVRFIERIFMCRNTVWDIVWISSSFSLTVSLINFKLNTGSNQFGNWLRCKYNIVEKLGAPVSKILYSLSWDKFLFREPVSAPGIHCIFDMLITVHYCGCVMVLWSGGLWRKLLKNASNKRNVVYSYAAGGRREAGPWYECICIFCWQHK